MARKLPAKEQLVKLIVGAGQASPSPPVGPALGSKGVKSMDFCKVEPPYKHANVSSIYTLSRALIEFNALTAHMTPGTPIPALITVRPDRSFHFTLRTPPTSTLLLTAAGVAPSKGAKRRGANTPGRTPDTAVNTADPLFRATSQRASPQTSPGGGSLPAGHSSASSAGGGAEVGLGIVHLVSKVATGPPRTAGSGGGSVQVGEVSLKHVYEIARIKREEERLKGMTLESLVRSVVAQARGVGVGVVP